METCSKGLRDGVQPLSSYADVIALAIIALILGVSPRAGANCSLGRLLWPDVRVEASGPAPGYGGSLSAGTGWLCR